MTNLTEVIKAFIEGNNRVLRTTIPAKIISLDYDIQKATVESLIQRRDDDGSVHDVAVMLGIPLQTMCANSGQLSFPIAEGDTGLLMVSDNSIDRLIYSDGTKTVDPADQRTHSLSDAIFLPGLRMYSQAYGIDQTKVVLRHNAGINNANNEGENAIHLHTVGDTEAIVLGGNRHTDQLATIKINQDGSIKITADEGNSLLSEFHLRPDGSIFISANDGTNIEMIQGGDITVNSPGKVQVNCKTSDVNASTLATIDAPGIHLNGSSGKVLTTESINPCTGVPFSNGSSTVKAGNH